MAHAVLAAAAAMGAHAGVITDFWEAAEPASVPAHEAALRRFRDTIVAAQTQCEKTCTVKGYVGGTAANLRRHAYYVLEATLSGCALLGRFPSSEHIALNTGEALRSRCEASGRKGFECYFRPVTTCRKGDGGKMRLLKGEGIYQAGERWQSIMLDRVANRTGLRSEPLVLGTLLAWIMRPQPELREALGLYGAAAGLGSAAGRETRVAMHIRKGDKHSLYGKHLVNHSWRVATDTYAAWGRRVAAYVGAERVMFMTDDMPSVRRLVGGSAGGAAGLFRHAPAPAFCLPAYGAGLLGKGRGAVMLKGSKMRRYALQLNASKAPPPPECGPAYLLDDGVQFFAGMLLMAQTAAFVGTQVSNIGAAIVELMATQRHPPVFFDLLNDFPRPFLSDENMWHAGIFNYPTRNLGRERLATGATLPNRSYDSDPTIKDCSPWCGSL